MRTKKTSRGLHFAAELFIGITSYAIAFDYVKNIFDAVKIAMLVVLFFGLAKEVFSQFLSEYFHKLFPKYIKISKWSWTDLGYSLTGGLAGSLLGILMVYILR